MKLATFTSLVKEPRYELQKFIVKTLQSCVNYFFFYNVVDNETHYVLECPFYNFTRDEFPSLCQM